ncbi:MAG: hypothetical protein ABIJ97_11850 [Bacteroidota bacterium]
MNEIIAKLNAIYNLALRIKKEYPSTIPREEVDKLYVNYQKTKEKADNLRPDLFESFSICKIDSHLLSDETRYNKIAIEKICTDISYYLDILNGINDMVVANFSVTKEGVFFTGQSFDALMKIGEIIESANNEIILIDSYLNDKIIRFIKSKNTKSNLTIVTSNKTMNDALKYSIELAERQYGKLNIIYNDSFHDRFVLIDKVDIYHFGASLKDAGKKGFMYSLIQEESLKLALLDQLNKIIYNA